MDSTEKTMYSKKNRYFIFSMLAIYLVLTIASSTGTANSTVTSSSAVFVPSGYTQVWGDEFNGTSLDTTKWYRQGVTCVPWYPNEIEANSNLDGNGLLVLKATKDSNGAYGGGVASICDNTGKKNYEFKYGYVEIRAKFPDTNEIDGIGTDLWLMSSNRWPPEIDITESGSGPMDTTNNDGVSTAVNSLKMTRHCNTADGSSCTGTLNGNDRSIESGNVFIHDSNGNPVNLAKDFHIYGLEWTPTSIIWLLDGVEKFKVTTGIPNEMMYPILEVAPGSWGSGQVKSNTPFPTSGYIDYIRIYQKSTTPDITPPTISSVSSSSIRTSGATIIWNTNEASDSRVEYGKTTAYGNSTALNTALITSHSQSLSGLAASTTYHYRVKSKDAAGNLATSADNTFTTLSLPVLTSISITPSSASVAPGTMRQFTASAADQYGNPYLSTITWRSSNMTVGTISSTGLFNAIIAGTTTITASATSGTTVEKTATVTVTKQSTGLAAYWKFDENTSTTTFDLSGNANKGTVSGATWTAGKVGNALKFNGASSYVAVPDSPSLDATALTFISWIKNSKLDSQTTIERIAAKKVNWDDPNGWSIEMNSGGRITVIGSGSTYTAISVIPAWDSNFHHLAVVMSGTSAQIYLDGSLKGTSAIDRLVANSAALSIGRIEGEPAFFNGTIDEVKIFNRYLNAAEIKADYEGMTWNVSVIPNIPPADQLEGFENLGNWTVGGTDASQQVDIINFKEGTQGLKLIATNGNRAYTDKAINNNFSTASNFSIWLYIPANTNISLFRVYFTSTGSRWSKYFTYSKNSGFQSGWNKLIFNKSSLINYNGENWNNKMSRIRIAVYPTTVKNTNVTVDDLRYQ